MYTAPYFKADGSQDGERELPVAIFDGSCNEFAVHAAVRTHLNNRRRGTGAAKNRAAVRGGSRKPWRQKGTGRARQGTIRAPQWRGGGMAFPPTPRSWRQRLPRKIKALARRSALSDRAAGGRVFLGELPRMERPRTREMVSYLGAIEADGKVLVLTDSNNPNIHLSCRNLPDVLVRPFGEESVYDLVWAGTVLIEGSALPSHRVSAADDAVPAEESSESALNDAEPVAEAGASDTDTVPVEESSESAPDDAEPGVEAAASDTDEAGPAEEDTEPAPDDAEPVAEAGAAATDDAEPAEEDEDA